ncbi:MAG: hypothetical protein AB1473_09870 [Thermodesulfobacteriota bacterium]
MTENGSRDRGRVPLKSFLSDFRSAMPDQELREKYELSPRAFLSLIKALLDKKVISSQDLERRKEISIQRDQAKEAAFLANLYICPYCGHPSPLPFEQCPACELDVKDVLGVQNILSSETVVTEEHAYVQEAEVEVIEEIEESSAEEERAGIRADQKQQKGKPSAVSTIRSLFSRKNSED